MKCKEMDLIGCLDRGKLSLDEQAHLKECLRCRMELQRLKQGQRLLSKYFLAQALNHPASEELTSYALGQEVKQPEIIARHLAGCQPCRELVELAKEFNQEFSAQPSLARVKMPDALMAKVRERRQAYLARNLGEVIAIKSRKQAEKIKVFLERLMVGKFEPLPVAAAPEDLTRAKRKPAKKKSAKKKLSKKAAKKSPKPRGKR